MEGLFFLFAVDLWTTMPQRPSLCCGFLCFSWLLVCSFDHSPFSHFPCSVSCVLCFRSSSYAIFLTAGLMCYWTSTCGTRRLERQCVRAHEYVLRSKRAHLWLQGPSFLRGVTLPQAHIVAYAPPFEAPWCGFIMGLVWKQRQLLPSAKTINRHLPPQARHDTALRPWDSRSDEPWADVHTLLDASGVFGRETDCCWCFSMVTMVLLQSVGQGELRKRLAQDSRTILSLLSALTRH